MIFSKLLLINTLQRLEAQTLGHYCLFIKKHFMDTGPGFRVTVT